MDFVVTRSWVELEPKFSGEDSDSYILFFLKDQVHLFGASFCIPGTVKCAMLGCHRAGWGRSV